MKNVIEVGSKGRGINLASSRIYIIHNAVSLWFSWFFNSS